MRRREPGPPALEALDPLTGRSLAQSYGGDDSLPSTRPRSRRARRFRGLSIALASLAVATGTAGAYFGLTIFSLRGIERTWRASMAVDAARAAGDRQVRKLLEAVADDGGASDAPLGAIGREASRHLERSERALTKRRIFDSKVSDLRDEMVDALRFRRFQMAPQRRQIGDTPLQKVEAALATQLTRWQLDPVAVARPRLSSVDEAVAGLRQYADAPTNSVLFALDERRLMTIDVDSSSINERLLPRAAHKVVAVAGGVAVVDGVEVAVYGPDAATDAMLRIPGEDAFATADETGDLWIVEGGRTAVRRLDPRAGSDEPSPATALPDTREPVGATAEHLVLRHPATGRLELWSPTTRAETARLTANDGRFLAASGDRVLWQGPLPFGEARSDGFLHLLRLGSNGRDLIALGRTEAASAAFARDGTAAVAAGPRAGRLGSILVVAPDTTALIGTAGPRAAVAEGALAWSNDGKVLFYLTPEGRIALLRRGDPPGAESLRTALEKVKAIAVMGR